MIVVINIEPGDTLNDLMSFMTRKTITFSVTDKLSKLIDKSGRIECATQTDNDHDQPVHKKPRMVNGFGGDDCASPSSSATSSENTLKDGADKEEKATNADEAEEDDTTSTEYVQHQLMEALLKIKTENEAEPHESGTDDVDDPSVNTNEEISMNLSEIMSKTAANMNGAVRYKQSYASSKRGICQVCYREVSLITTHRKRHAITHLGFKTLKCPVCHKFFSRQDLCGGHFKKDHPDLEVVPFIDTMSKEDENQLKLMMTLCFPKEVAKKGEKRTDE